MITLRTICREERAIMMLWFKPFLPRAHICNNFYPRSTKKVGRNGYYYPHFIEGETEAQRNNLSLRQWLTGRDRSRKQASFSRPRGLPDRMACLLFCWPCSIKLYPRVPKHGNSGGSLPKLHSREATQRDGVFAGPLRDKWLGGWQ